MPTAYLALSALVRAEPPAAAAQITEALRRAGALVTSAQRLGNQALVFGFELRAADLPPLRSELARVAELFDEAEAKLSEAERTLGKDTDLLASLHVALVHGAPDERVELPKVPG